MHIHKLQNTPNRPGGQLLAACHYKLGRLAGIKHWVLKNQEIDAYFPDSWYLLPDS
jgi:hypothetical protein